VVTPAFCESENLPLLYDRLSKVLAGKDWEWIVVDDHSPDATFAAIARLAAADSRVRGVRLARNFGSHAAAMCGIEGARGQAIAVLAGDLEDPPELLRDLIQHWEQGWQVVWGVRSKTRGRSLPARAASRIYHTMMRRFAGIEHLPEHGADCFLADRAVTDALLQFGERHNNLFVLLAWIGFRQTSVTYEKADRASGRSGWTMTKKIDLLMDSVSAFSYKPIRWMSVAGGLTALAGFVWACVVAANALLGHPPAGFSSLMVAVLLLSGIQMLMMGVLGEYLWRALDESRRRPRYLIEESTNTQGPREQDSHGQS
jgi:glycosyltransferase involved in cell wall biosynthesis